MSKNQLVNALEFSDHETLVSAQLGKVIHDPRGNAIWDWTIDTAVLAQTTVTELLGKLAAPIELGLGLELEVEVEVEVERSPRWGGDPYNRSCL